MKQENFNQVLRLTIYRKMYAELGYAYECITEHPGEDPEFKQNVDALQNLGVNLLGYLTVAVLDKEVKKVDIDSEFPHSFLLTVVDTLAGKISIDDFLPLLEQAIEDFAQKVKDSESSLSPKEKVKEQIINKMFDAISVLSSDRKDNTDENEDEDEDDQDEQSEGGGFIEALLSHCKGIVVIAPTCLDDEDDDEDGEDEDE